MPASASLPPRRLKHHRHAAPEWPTLALLVVIQGGLLGLTWLHTALPMWLWLPLVALFSAWWSSAQHELIHDHPTRWRALNNALGTPPWWLWPPFERYRRSHLTHHRDERLTDPLDDPESRYWTPSCWLHLGRIGQALARPQTTLAGRLAFGAIWSVACFWGQEAHAIAGGHRATLRAWAWHAVWVSLLLVRVLGIFRVPLWQYLLGVVWGGTTLSLIRSFAEHRAHEAAPQRTAIVENAGLVGLLFLHDNLHAAHHRWPAVAWYRLPALYRQNRAALLRRNGGLVYDSYGDVARRFLLRPHDVPVHPAGRAPGRMRAAHPGFTAEPVMQECSLIQPGVA